MHNVMVIDCANWLFEKGFYLALFKLFVYLKHIFNRVHETYPLSHIIL